MKKVVLMTGSTSRLGILLKDSLKEKGWIVYEGAKVTALQSKYSLKLDITKDSDCSRAVKSVIEREGVIHALLNIAAKNMVGPAELNTPTEYLDILNTNSVGAYRLIREVIPHMRRQKKGRIINVTSLNGLVSLPNFALYSSSKFALEALGIAIGCEVTKDGIIVTNVAPGAIASDVKNPNFPHKSARQKSRIIRFLMPMITYEMVAEKITSLLENPNPPLRVLIGNDAIIAYNLQRFLPQFVWNKLMYYVWNKK